MQQLYHGSDPWGSGTRLEIDKVIVQHQSLQKKQLQQLNVNFLYRRTAGKIPHPAASPPALQLAQYHHIQTTLLCAKFSAQWRERATKDLRPHLWVEGSKHSGCLMDMALNKLPWNAAPCVLGSTPIPCTAGKSFRAAQLTARRYLQALWPWTQKSRRDLKIDLALPQRQC